MDEPMRAEPNGVRVPSAYEHAWITSAGRCAKQMFIGANASPPAPLVCSLTSWDACHPGTVSVNFQNHLFSIICRESQVNLVEVRPLETSHSTVGTTRKSDTND